MYPKTCSEIGVPISLHLESMCTQDPPIPSSRGLDSAHRATYKLPVDDLLDPNPLEPPVCHLKNCTDGW